MADFVKHTLRVNLDNNTAVIVTPDLSGTMQHLAVYGVWVTKTLWYPASRIVSVEVVD